MKIYVDANVILDYILNRRVEDRDRGYLARMFFQDCITYNVEIIISDHTKEEVIGHERIDEETWIDFVTEFNDLIRFVEADKTELNNAETHHNRPDYLHMLIAERVEADYLVTADKDFIDIEGGVDVVPSGLVPFDKA